MMTLENHPVSDALTDALASLVGLLHPDAGLGGTPVAPWAAHRLAVLFLQRLRHHLHESGLVIAALVETEAPCASRLEPILGEHRLIQRLAHDLSARIRRRDLPSARDIARRLLLLLMDHLAQETRVLREVVRGMDERSTGLFTDALFDRMIAEAARSGRASAPDPAIADLHSLYVRLIRYLRNFPEEPVQLEADHEHPCRR